MFNISKETLERLRKEYPTGCRVELTKMNDPYRTDLVPGCKGTVTGVDDAGSIHVRWDIGSSLAVVYGEDACKKLDAVTITCYGSTEVWDSRADAMKFYLEGMTACEGAERDRYTNIYLQLLEGRTVCEDIADDDRED
jgi:hypothetical protein